MNTNDLKHKIAQYKAQVNKKPANNSKANNPLSLLSISAEIIAGVSVGVGVGHMFDNIFNTTFTFKVICLILAFIAVLVNIYRHTQYGK